MDHVVWSVSRERGIVSRTTSVREATPSSCQHVLCPGVLPPRGEAWLPCERPGVRTPQWRVKCSGWFTHLGADSHSTPSPLGPPPLGAVPPHPSFSSSRKQPGAEHLATFRAQITPGSEQHEVLSGAGRPPHALAFSLGLSQGAQRLTGRLGGWGLRAGLWRLQEERVATVVQPH